MEDDFIDLEWWRDPQGRFELVENDKLIKWTGTNPLVRYRPFQVDKWKDDIVDDFLALKTPAHALAFVKNYGFLALKLNSAPADPVTPAIVMKRCREGEEVSAIIDFAEAARVYLEGGAVGTRALYDVLVQNGSPLVQTVEVSLEPDHKTKGVRLRYSVWNLFKAIHLQVWRSITGGYARLCKRCGAPFRVGPNASRAMKARFCTETCKKAWFNEPENRSKGKSQ